MFPTWFHWAVRHEVLGGAKSCCPIIRQKSLGWRSLISLPQPKGNRYPDPELGIFSLHGCHATCVVSGKFQTNESGSRLMQGTETWPSWPLQPTRRSLNHARLLDTKTVVRAREMRKKKTLGVRCFGFQVGKRECGMLPFWVPGSLRCDCLCRVRPVQNLFPEPVSSRPSICANQRPDAFLILSESIYGEVIDNPPRNARSHQDTIEQAHPSRKSDHDDNAPLDHVLTLA
jgi:hypothetical protein